LAGLQASSSIINIIVSGSIYAGAQVGGLVGFQNSVNSIISNSNSSSTVRGTSYVGGLVGISLGLITDSYSSGNVFSGLNLGGLVGKQTSGNIINSYSESNITGTSDYNGGLVGKQEDGSISSSYSIGNVNAKARTGGLVGESNGSITNSYSTSNATGTSYVGGLVGRLSNNGSITNSYSIGKLYGTSYVGGLVGSGNYLTIKSYWDSTTSGIVTSATGTSKTTAEMQNQSTFIDWDFNNIWTMNNYPYLRSMMKVLYYNAGENGSIIGTTTQLIIKNNNGTEVIAIPNEGYHFTSWSDGVLTASRIDLNITSDISVTANFEIDTHTLTYIAGTHGTISGSSTQIINYGSNGIQVEAMPDEDYRFVEWSDGSTSSIRIDYNIREDKSFTAEFVINQRTLSYTAGSNGTISGDTIQTITIGQDGEEVTAIPNTGYHFTSWSDGVLTASRTDLNVTNSISVVANFAINSYLVEYITIDGGTITGSSTQTINHGSDGMSIVATPNRGYRFTGWSDGSTEATRYESNVTQNIELTASFRRNSKTYTTCTTYEYADWSFCDNGIQTRELINAYPLGCIQNDSIIRQSCDIEEDEEEKNKEEDKETTKATSTPTVTEVKKEKENNNIVIFTKDLQFNDTDEEIKLLQKFLNSQGFTISQTGVGSPGKETNYFGLLTKQALIKYQEAYMEDILTPAAFTKGTGYFGERTRGYINKIFNL
jgi:hypothetical protein